MRNNLWSAVSRINQAYFQEISTGFDLYLNFESLEGILKIKN
jgi:hypothetical protein